MSMPMRVSDEETTARPIAPMLRLADDVCDEYAGDAEAAAAAPQARVVDGRLIADDAAELPAACVVCGDTVGAIALVTPRGRVGFSICREHLVSAIARVAVGAAVCVVAAGLLVKGQGGVGSRLLVSAGLSLVGAALVASAVPIWTWRGKDGARRLFRVHRDVVASVERAGRV